MFYVYIIASQSGTLYTGFTSNLIKRIWEHKNNLVNGFSKKYSCHRLIYYEGGDDYDSVLAREKQIKNWRREKKEKLIKAMNPHWKDLYQEILS